MKQNRVLAAALVLMTLLLLLSGCAGKRDGFATLEEFDGATLGVAKGSLYKGYSETLFPNAEVQTYNTFADVLQALKQGKIDGCMLDEPNFNAVKRTEASLSCMDVPPYDVDLGFGFQKTAEGNRLREEMNAILDELKASGEIDRLIDKWYGEKEPTEELAIPDFSDNATPLKVAVDLTRKPFVYMKNGENSGFEMEVFYLFCERYGYKPTYEVTAFSSGIAGLSAGTYDIVIGGLYMTEERKQSVNFSDPYMSADVVMVQNGEEEAVGFLAGMKSGFRKTFIEEGRWKLILKGIATTLLITGASALLGSLLGFGLYMLCRAFGRAARILTRIFTVITNGTPIVVILMILYYVVFGKTDITGVAVSILGFGLTTAAFVYEKLTVAVNGIEAGQTEAALAMGFTQNGLFFRVVLPQAMRFFLPLYRAEMSALVKATSIVGYIAVQDLTQVSDIIRNNTYEAFFPLIASAVIYLLLSFLISELIALLVAKTEPKSRRRERILRGVCQK